MSSYLRFLLTDPRFLGFGFLVAFASSFGQTFYISMYGAEIREAYGLSHGGFGQVYMLATLTSGFLLIWVGKALDRFDLRPYAVIICAGLGLACLAMGLSQSVLLLGVAIFLLRFFGQGLMSHAATTSMARYFEDRMRGRAVSFAALGFPVGEAVFPPVAVLLLLTVDWRSAWTGSAAVVWIAIVPLVWFMLANHAHRHQSLVARTSAAPAQDGPEIRQWTRAEAMGDPRFWIAIVAMMGPPFVITGVFFHQVHLVETKGWELEWFAALFSLYAGMQVSASVLTGILIDRFGAVRLAPAYLLPASFGLLALWLSDSPLAAVVFMALGGISGGASQTLISTVWAELYGVLHLGSIRALVFGFSVLSSALGPYVMGEAIDAGVTMGAIALCCAAYYAAGSLTLWLNFRGAVSAKRPS
jgi:MFS family permease